MNKKANLSLLVLFGFLSSSLINPNYWSEPIKAKAEVPTYTQTVVFPERSYASGSQTITIPENARNVKATTNNGSVSTSKSGNQLTVNVSGGNYHRTGTYYDSTYYNTYVNDYRSGSSSYSGSYPYSISYNSGGYSGTLYQSGSPYVSSGSYTPESYTTVSTSRTTSAGGSTSSLPSSIPYSSNGYTGTMYPSGSPTVLSGSYSAQHSITANGYRQTSPGGSASSLPSSISYNSGGYSGTLTKDGSATVFSGKYTAADTKTVREPEFMKLRYDYHIYDSKIKDWRYHHTVADPYSEPQTQSYNEGGYKGTLTRDEVRIVRLIQYDIPKNPKNGDIFKALYYERYYRFSGSVTRPASDTRVWNQDYQGTVTKPASDTRVWEQNYSGTAVKPAVDTRGYTQSYSGMVYAGGYATNYWYQYGVTVTYEADLNDPNLNLSYDKDAGVIRASATDDEYGVDYIQLPNGSITYGDTATYAVNSGGTYTFTAVDKGGNSTVKSITLKSPPITTSTEIPNTTWTNRDSYWLKINTEAFYDETPLVTLLKDGVKVKEERTNEMMYDVTANGSYRVTVKDGSIVSTKDVTVSNFDRTAPNLSLSYDGSTPNDGLDIVATAVDTQSGVKQMTMPDGSVITGASGRFKTLTEGTFEFVLEDKAGNKQTVQTSIDKPTLTVKKQVSGATNVSSYNLISSFTPRYTATGQIKNLNTNVTTTTNTLNTPVSSNGEYKFQANDGGILSDVVSETVDNFDRVAPNGTLVLDGSTPDDGLDMIVDATDDASGVKQITLPDGSVVPGDHAVYKTKTSGSFSFIIEDEAGNKKTLSQTINKPVLNVTKSITGVTNADDMTLTAKFTPQYVTTGNIKNMTNGTTINANENNYVVTENGTYRFQANDGGVLSDVVEVVVGNFDRTAPTGIISYDGSTPNDGLDINISATDDNAGIKSITLPNGNVVTTTTGNYKTTVEGSFDFILEDKAGNKRTVTATVQKPTLNVTPAITGQTNVASYNLTASFAPKYVATGQIKNITTGSSTTANTLAYSVSANGNYKFQANDGGLLSDVVSIDVNNFDRTAPTGTIDYDSSKPEDGLKIIVKAFDSESDVKSITLPDGTVKNGSEAEYFVNKEGTYNFILEDEAGNKKTLTANITKPTVTAVKTVTTPTNASKYQITVTASSPKYASKILVEELKRNESFDTTTVAYMAKKNGDYSFRVNDGGILSDVLDVSVTNFDRVKPDVSLTQKAKTAISTTVNVKVQDRGDLKK